MPRRQVPMGAKSQRVAQVSSFGAALATCVVPKPPGCDPTSLGRPQPPVPVALSRAQPLRPLLQPVLDGAKRDVRSLLPQLLQPLLPCLRESCQTLAPRSSRSVTPLSSSPCSFLELRVGRLPTAPPAHPPLLPACPRTLAGRSASSWHLPGADRCLLLLLLTSRAPQQLPRAPAFSPAGWSKQGSARRNLSCPPRGRAEAEQPYSKRTLCAITPPAQWNVTLWEKYDISKKDTEAAACCPPLLIKPSALGTPDPSWRPSSVPVVPATHSRASPPCVNAFWESTARFQTGCEINIAWAE